MNEQLLPFSVVELGFIALYLGSLLIVGYFGLSARTSDSMTDFYLGGRTTGPVVLVLTLYATQYSGNTLFGFSGKAYRAGFSWAVSVHFMTAIVVCYLLFAPKLYAISSKQSFLTPADFLQYRFQNPALSLSAAIVMIVAIANYLLAQLMAMGRAMEGLSGADPEVAYCGGVVVLAIIIMIYESMGGFRAVAWTDAIQGSVLLLGFLGLLVMVFLRFGSLSEATDRLSQETPGMVAAPTGEGINQWISYVIIVGLGGALYPQAMQRIYSARNARTLRMSFAIMAFLPLITTLVTLIVGIMGRAYIDISDLAAGQSDSLLTVICREIQQHSLFGRGLVVLLFAAILAAIMSTADSVLLTMSCMLTKDIYAVCRKKAPSEQELTRVGKRCSWGLIAISVVLAILLRNNTLITLIDRKFDLLVQLVPAFMLGIHWNRLRGDAVMAGMLAGVVVAVGMTIGGYGKLLGFHAGLYGLIVNLAIALPWSFFVPQHPKTVDVM